MLSLSFFFFLCYSSVNAQVVDEVINSQVIFNEIMYNYRVDGLKVDGTDFLELKNLGSTEYCLDGAVFSKGLGGLEFVGSTVQGAPCTHTVAPNGGIYTFAQVPGTFSIIFGTQPSNFLQWPVGKLSNSGEGLELRSRDGALVARAKWETSGAWPKLADGSGFSLVPVDPSSATADQRLPSSWRLSANVRGSPTIDDPPLPVFPNVLISEVMSNPSSPAQDWVELQNLGPSVADISGWFLSDTTANFTMHKLPPGTSIPPSGFLLLDASQTGVRFSELGDDVWLVAGESDATSSNLLPYQHGFSFPAAPRDLSFVRHVNSAGVEQFPLAQSPTPNAANQPPQAPPLAGNVAIVELMYQPPILNCLSGWPCDEYVRIENLTPAPVALFDQDQQLGWEVTGFNYTFAIGQQLPAMGSAWIVRAQPEDFRRLNGLPADALIFEAADGSLSDAGERISLSRPGPRTPAPESKVPYYRVDSVRFNVKAPWPVAAAGTGPGLVRCSPELYGDDPQVWSVDRTCLGERDPLRDVEPFVPGTGGPGGGPGGMGGDVDPNAFICCSFAISIVIVVVPTLLIVGLIIGGVIFMVRRMNNDSDLPYQLASKNASGYGASSPNGNMHDARSAGGAAPPAWASTPMTTPATSQHAGEWSSVNSNAGPPRPMPPAHGGGAERGYGGPPPPSRNDDWGAGGGATSNDWGAPANNSTQNDWGAPAAPPPSSNDWGGASVVVGGSGAAGHYCPVCNQGYSSQADLSMHQEKRSHWG